MVIIGLVNSLSTHTSSMGIRLTQGRLNWWSKIPVQRNGMAAIPKNNQCLCCSAFNVKWVSVWKVEFCQKAFKSNPSNKHENRGLDVCVESYLLRIFYFNNLLFQSMTRHNKGMVIKTLSSQHLSKKVRN